MKSWRRRFSRFFNQYVGFFKHIRRGNGYIFLASCIISDTENWETLKHDKATIQDFFGYLHIQIR